MGVHVKSIAWHVGPPPGPMAPGSAAAAQHALSSSPGRSRDARFDTNMVIVLAALLFALVLNSVARCFVRWARREHAREDGRAGRSGGIKKRALRSIPVEVYGACGADGVSTVAADVCAICLGEFADGEKVRVLPRCAHGFHVGCVDTWLASHNSCPTCRGSVLEGAASRSAPVAAPSSPVPTVAGASQRPASEAAITVAIG